MHSGKRRIRRDEVKWLVVLFLGSVYWLASGHAPQATPKPPNVVRCAECGATMRVIEVTYEPVYTLSEHARAYLDSG